MVKTKLVGAAGRYGVRYGKHVRKRTAAIESRQRIKQICPFCEGTAKRLSKGIWKCKKCGKKFAAHAYYVEPMNIKVDKAKNIEEAKALKKHSTKKKIETTKKTTGTTKKK